MWQNDRRAQQAYRNLRYLRRKDSRVSLWISEISDKMIDSANMTRYLRRQIPAIAYDLVNYPTKWLTALAESFIKHRADDTCAQAFLTTGVVRGYWPANLIGWLNRNEYSTTVQKSYGTGLTSQWISRCISLMKNIHFLVEVSFLVLPKLRKLSATHILVN